jgi:hypothetical protein
VKKLPCFDDLIELDVLLVGSLRLGFHDSINCFLLNAFKIEFLGAKCSTHPKCLGEVENMVEGVPH